jgi:hypothetical protein
MSLHQRLVRALHWFLAIQFILQPVLLAIPPNIVRAAEAQIAETFAEAGTQAPQTSEQSFEDPEADPLTVIVPAPPDITPQTELMGMEEQLVGVNQTTMTDGGSVYVANESQIGRTRDFFATSPDWQDVTGDITGEIRDCVLDPADPANVAWVATTNGVWRTGNLDTVTPVWTLTSSVATVKRILVLDSGRALIISDTDIQYSDDDGQSWTVSSGFLGKPSKGAGISPSGTIYVGSNRQHGTNTLCEEGIGLTHITVSTDDGATWQEHEIGDLSDGVLCQAPITALYSPQDDLIYFIADRGPGALFLSLDGGQTASQIGLFDDTWQKETYEAIGSWTDGEHLIAQKQVGLQAYQFDIGGTTPALATTGIFTGEGSGILVLPDDGLGWARLSSAGSPTTVITRSDDGGANWEDATGNSTSIRIVVRPISRPVLSMALMVNPYPPPMRY